MTLIIYDQFSRVAPLGVRFWDVAAQTLVISGLVVTARTPQNKVLPMFANTKGVYILQDVPGLRPFETGDGSDEFWEDMPPSRPYTLEVRDTERRFHPFTFEADVPTREIFAWDCPLSPPLEPVNVPSGYVPVYSTAGRSLTGAMAVLRADLHDPDDDVPAAWAMLEVLLDGDVIGRGIADERGCTVVVFPYPEPIDTDLDSPLGLGLPLMEQIWTLTLRAYYAPSDPVPSVPDLCTLLNQPEADLWREWNSPADTDPFTGVDLHYGREAIAVSFDSTNEPLSRLYITPV